MTVRDTSLLARGYRGLRIAALWGVIAWLGWRIFAGRDALAGLELDLRPLPVLAAFLSAVLAYQLLFLGWISLLRRTGLHRNVPAGTYARIWWFSYLYRYVPGKFLLLIERARRGAAAGIPYAVGATLPIIETLVAILAGGIVSLLAISYYATNSFPVLFAIAALALIVILLVPPAFRRLIRSRALTERYPDIGVVGLRALDILALLGYYLAHYLLVGVSFFLLLTAAVPLAWPELPGVCGVYALSHVLSILVVVAPGGLGVREGALAVQLQRLAPAGVADVLAIAARLWFSAVELLCFGVVALRYRK